MNERIKELAKQAGVLADYGEDIKEGRYQIGGSLKGMEKFAELIVKECVSQCWTVSELEHKGDVVYQCSKRIQKHFGVEE